MRSVQLKTLFFNGPALPSNDFDFSHEGSRADTRCMTGVLLPSSPSPFGLSKTKPRKQPAQPASRQASKQADSRRVRSGGKGGIKIEWCVRGGEEERRVRRRRTESRHAARAGSHSHFTPSNRPAQARGKRSGCVSQRPSRRVVAAKGEWCPQYLGCRRAGLRKWWPGPWKGKPQCLVTWARRAGR